MMEDFHDDYDPALQQVEKLWVLDSKRRTSMASFQEEKIVTIRYVNYRGETSVRRIVPIEIRFASTEWHPEPQWILEAFDVDKDAQRSFALKDILDWNVNRHSANGKLDFED